MPAFMDIVDEGKEGNCECGLKIAKQTNENSRIESGT